jgi:Domain of unknown function (DUF4329)
MSKLSKPPSPPRRRRRSRRRTMPDLGTDVRGREPPPPADRHGAWADSHQAAIAALDHINPFSVRDNVEYAGLIYQRGPNDFDFTGPVRGTAGDSNPYDAPAPPGTRVVGTYHTHGDYTIMGPDRTFTRTSDPAEDTGGGDRFSEGDYRSHREMGGTNQRYTSYLGTPSGAYLSWNPFSDPQTGTIATRPRNRS